MTDLFGRLNQVLWGNGLVLLLLGTGAYCLVHDRCVPLRSLFSFRRHTQGSGHAHSPFQACMTSLAAAMGTGNIAGVATALTLGGAGAVFWMWVAALLGMGLIYAENVLSCRFRKNGITGAAAYLRYGLQSPALSGIFAVCCVAASFGMGNMTQSHAMAQILSDAWHVPALVTGLLTAGVVGAVISGGAKRIGRFTAAVVPLLSVIYLGAAVIVIFRCRAHLGDALASVFREAFGMDAVGGGISGAAVSRAVSVGVRRGVFSNEAGLGSSGLLHGEADSNDPSFLGVCGMIEVFVDTFVCCTATALAILCADVQGADGAGLVLLAFRRGLGTAADWMLPPVVAMFALCTLIGWSYCGCSALGSITGGKFLMVYRMVFCMSAVLGAVMRLDMVWTMADMANACMAYCNLPGLLLLYPAACRTAEDRNAGTSHKSRGKTV